MRIARDQTWQRRPGQVSGTGALGPSALNQRDYDLPITAWGTPAERDDEGILRQTFRQALGDAGGSLLPDADRSRGPGTLPPGGEPVTIPENPWTTMGRGDTGAGDDRPRGGPLPNAGPNVTPGQGLPPGGLTNIPPIPPVPGAGTTTIDPATGKVTTPTTPPTTPSGTTGTGTGSTGTGTTGAAGTTRNVPVGGDFSNVQGVSEETWNDPNNQNLRQRALRILSEYPTTAAGIQQAMNDPRWQADADLSRATFNGRDVINFGGALSDGTSGVPVDDVDVLQAADENGVSTRPFQWGDQNAMFGGGGEGGAPVSGTATPLSGLGDFAGGSDIAAALEGEGGMGDSDLMRRIQEELQRLLNGQGAGSPRQTRERRDPIEMLLGAR